MARPPVIIAGALALLASFGLVGCERPPEPGITASQPRPVDPGESAEASKSEELFADADPERSEPARPRRGAEDSAARTIEMDEPAQPEPPPPPYVSIVELLDAARRPEIRATPIAPHKLVVETQNVKRIRLTREGLPLARNRSIVLQIDGQGIEWTRDCLKVELEWSPAGAWSIVRTVKP